MCLREPSALCVGGVGEGGDSGVKKEPPSAVCQGGGETEPTWGATDKDSTCFFCEAWWARGKGEGPRNDLAFLSRTSWLGKAL